MYNTNEVVDPSLGQQPQQPETVLDQLNQRILRCQKNLEEACALKAKAETLGLFNHPMELINSLNYF